jgi:hypothetical protein
MSEQKPALPEREGCLEKVWQGCGCVIIVVFGLGLKFLLAYALR